MISEVTIAVVANNVCCSEVCDLVMKVAVVVKVADSIDGNCLCCSEHSELICCVVFEVYVYIDKHIHIWLFIYIIVMTLLRDC